MPARGGWGSNIGVIPKIVSVVLFLRCLDCKGNDQSESQNCGLCAYS